MIGTIVRQGVTWTLRPCEPPRRILSPSTRHRLADAVDQHASTSVGILYIPADLDLPADAFEGIPRPPVVVIGNPRFDVV